MPRRDAGRKRTWIPERAINGDQYIGRRGRGPQEAALKIVGEADDEAARTYIFRGEDHTLGNALRHVLMRQKDVEFCGYSVPHPSEPFVHVRLQTTGAPARAVLDDG